MTTHEFCFSHLKPFGGVGRRSGASRVERMEKHGSACLGVYCPLSVRDCPPHPCQVQATCLNRSGAPAASPRTLEFTLTVHFQKYPLSGKETCGTLHERRCSRDDSDSLPSGQSARTPETPGALAEKTPSCFPSGRSRALTHSQQGCVIKTPGLDN